MLRVCRASLNICVWGVHSSKSGGCQLAVRCLIGRGGRSESIAPVRLNYWPQELTPRYPISSSNSPPRSQLFHRNNARPPWSCPICDSNLVGNFVLKPTCNAVPKHLEILTNKLKNVLNAIWTICSEMVNIEFSQICQVYRTSAFIVLSS